MQQQDQAALSIVGGIEHERSVVVRPRVFRLLFLLSALVPGLMARRLAAPHCRSVA